MMWCGCRVRAPPLVWVIGADEQACSVLRERGYPAAEDHRAAPVGDEHLGADLVVALGREHVGVLQACGVADDRLWHVDVRNPLFGPDFEVAFSAIDAAMPGLHEWLDGRLTAPGFGRLETAVGFRFWTGLPGDVLRSPYHSHITWPTKSSYAGCLIPGHEPPAPECECGWYADVRGRGPDRAGTWVPEGVASGRRNWGSSIRRGRIWLSARLNCSMCWHSGHHRP